MTDRETYAAPQIILHWAIVALIIGQMLSADGMSDFFDLAKDSEIAPGLPSSGAALAHAAMGGTILFLVIVRFALRLHYGAPPAPKDMSPLLKIVSRLTHFGLYALLVALPLSGLAALLISPEAGDAHEALKNVLYAIAAAHVLGALTHLLIFRDGVFFRMLPMLRR